MSELAGGACEKGTGRGTEYNLFGVLGQAGARDAHQLCNGVSETHDNL